MSRVSPGTTTRRRFLTAAAVAAAVALPLAGCTSAAGTSGGDGGGSEDGGFVIGVANGNIGNTWRAQYIEEIQKVGDELKSQGVISDLLVANTANDVNEQLSQLNDMLTQGVDAVMVNPVSSTSLAPFVAKARAQGVEVVINDNAAAYEGTYFVGYPNYDYGKIEASWLAEQIGGTGDIVRIDGVAGTTGNDLRVQGNTDALKEAPGVKVVGSTEGGWSETQAENVMSTFLTANQDISGVLVQDVMPEGVLRAFGKANRPIVATTGDYNFGYLRLWDQNPDLQSIAVTNSPHIGADGLKFTAKLLQGFTFDDDALSANPVDPQMKNAYLVDYPYVITRDGERGAFMDGISDTTQVISVSDALEGNEDIADGNFFGAVISDELVDEAMSK